MPRSAIPTRHVAIRAARIALELSVGNSMVEIGTLKKQFKKMCLKYHPDRCKDPNVNANDKFIEVREAYQFLIGESTSFVVKSHTATKTSSPKPRHSSANSGDGNGSNRHTVKVEEHSRLANEALMPVMNAMDVLGINMNMEVLQGDVVENAYKRAVLRFHLKYKNHELGVSECDKKLGLTSTAYERILLHLNFKKHWSPPYEREYKRVQHRKWENVIISEYVKRQNLLQRLQEIQKDIQEQARLKAEKEARFHETTSRKLQQHDNNKHAVEHAKEYGGMYSAGHGQRYKDELDKQSKRQINQQYVAQEMHMMDHNLRHQHQHYHVKTTNQKRRARNTDNDSRKPPSKRQRGGDGARAGAAVDVGQNEDNPIVIEDSSNDGENNNNEAEDGDDSNDGDYEEHLDDSD